MMRKIFFTILFEALCFITLAQKVHTVKHGETLADIASLYNVAENEIKKINESADVLFPGLLLNIPQKNKPLPKRHETKEEIKMDKLEMKDGSYVMCKVVSIKRTAILIKQEEIEGNISIPIKDIIEIFYANGTKKRYGKR